MSLYSGQYLQILKFDNFIRGRGGGNIKSYLNSEVIEVHYSFPLPSFPSENIARSVSGGVESWKVLMFPGKVTTPLVIQYS